MNKGHLFIILAAMLWGTTGTSQGLVPSDVSSSVIGALRILIGGLILFLYAMLQRDFALSKKWNLKHLFLGIIMVALYQLTFFYGVRMAGVAVGTMVGIGSSPMFAGILAWIFYREKQTKRWILSTIVGILGLIFISIPLLNIKASLNFLGIILCLGAGLTYAIYTFSAKNLLNEHSANSVVGLLFLGGGIILSPFLLINDLSPLLTLKGIMVIIHLGVFATALAYFFFARGLKLIKVSETATLSLAEPLTATFLGITVLKESPNMFSIIGMVLIFVGILMLVRE